MCFLTAAEALSQKLKLQGNVSTVVSLCVGLSDYRSVGDKGRGREKGKGTEKVLKGLGIMQCFGANTCCSLSKGVEEAAAALLLETEGHIPSSEPHIRLLAGVQQHLCWFE